MRLPPQPAALDHRGCLGRPCRPQDQDLGASCTEEAHVFPGMESLLVLFFSHPEELITSIPNLVFIIVYSFSQRKPYRFYKLQAPQNLDVSLGRLVSLRDPRVKGAPSVKTGRDSHPLDFPRRL